MLQWSLSMLFFEARCLVAGTAIFCLLKSYGVLDSLLMQITRHFISVRMKLPVQLDKIVLRLHWRGSGELEIFNLRILAPTVHVRHVPSSELTHDEEEEDKGEEEEEEEAEEEDDEQEIVRIRSVFVSFFTLQSLLAIVSSGGTQLATDNVCIDGLRINIEVIDVVEEADDAGHGAREGDGLTPDDARGSSSRSGSSDSGGGSGATEGPRQLKKLLNIWLIANAVSGNSAPALTPDPQRRRRASVVPAPAPAPSSPPRDPFNLTWRESKTPEPEPKPRRTPSKETRRSPVVVVSPSVMASYGLPSLPSLPSVPAIPTVKARVVASREEKAHGGGFWGLGLGMDAGGQTLTGLLESAGLGAAAWDGARSSSGSTGGGAASGSSGSEGDSSSGSNSSSPAKAAPSLDPLQLLRHINDSAQDLMEEVQSGRLQSRLAKHVDVLQAQASEFKDQVLQEGLLTATSRRVKRSLHQSRHALEEDLRKKLPATVAELHARVVGPDDPSWTRDILSIDRVWMGGCLLVLDIEIRFRGVLPPVMRALERPVKIPRMVMEGIGHPAVAAEACGAAGAGIAPGAAGGVGGSGAKGWGRMAGPRLQDGWALPLLQRRLEIALIAEATRSNILGAVDEVLVLTSMQEREVAAERHEPRAEVEEWNFELT